MKKLIKMLLLALVLTCGFTGLTAFASAASSSSATGTYRYDLAFKVLNYLNKEREKAGLSKLKMDQSLTDQAMTRASECSIKYSHTRPNGKYFDSVGTTKLENIAYGYKTAKQVNTAWTNSKSHYKNMTTKKYKGVGIGCFQASDGTLYWTEEFGNYTSKAVQKSNYSTGSAKNMTTKIASVENKSSGIKITWDRTYGASGYYIYRKTSGGSYKKIKTISKGSKTSYTDKKVKSKTGKKYKYKVVPYTKSDGKSGKCNNATSIVRVAQPTSPSASCSGFGNVTVKWKKVSGATGYKISYSKDSSFQTCYTVTVKGGSTTSTVIDRNSIPTNWSKAYIRVNAYKTSGGKTYYSANSKKATITMTRNKLSAPTIKNVTSNSTGKANVAWNQVSNATGYRVYYSTSNKFTGNEPYVSVNSGNTTSCTISGLASGQTYYIKVMATAKDGSMTVKSNYSEAKSIKIS